MIALGLAVMLAAPACEKKQPETRWDDVGRPDTVDRNRQAAADLKAPPLFAHIPADTPYVFAAFEPIPEGYWKRVCEQMCPVIDKLLATADFGDSSGGRVGAAIVGELRGKLSREGLAELGIASDPRWALYSLEGLPVGRIEVADAGTLKATIERVASKGGLSLPAKTLGSQSYWHGVLGNGEAVAAGIVDDQLVMTIGPAGEVERVLPILFGDQKLPATMADGAALEKLAGEYGFAGYGLGYLDTARLIAGAYGDDAPEACRQALGKVSEVAPRVVFGYDEVSAKRASFAAVVELSPDAASRAQALETSIPGFTSHIPEGSLFAIGVGVDRAAVEPLIADIQSWADATGEACESETLQTLSGDSDSGLQLTDIVGGADLGSLSGGVAVLQDARLGGGMPQSLAGYIILGVSDAQAFLGSIEQLLSMAGASKLKADGTFRKLSLGPMSSFVKSPVKMAAKDGAVVVAAGDRSRVTAERAMSKLAGRTPLLLIGYDVGKLSKAMDSFYDMALAQQSPNAADMAIMRELNRAQAELIGLAVTTIHVTKRGVMLTGRADLR